MPEDQITALRGAPKPVASWYSITNEATTEGAPTRAKVNIFDAIGGWWGVSAAEFVERLDALDVDEVEVHVNSPGGAVWDGIAIMNALKAHRAKVIMIVDGLAASAASIVVMAGDEVVMAEGSQMMVHQASGGVWGNADYIRDMAAILDKIDNNLAGIYARRTGGTRASWRDLMRAETWYNADEAVEAGLADRADASLEAIDAEASFDLSVFNYAGRAQAPAPRRPADALRPLGMPPGGIHEVGVAADLTPEAPVSSEPGNTTRKESPMSDALKAGLRDRLGITDADLSEDGLLAALDEALQEQADETAPTAQVPEGTVLVDAAQFEALQAQAAEGAQARAEQVADRRNKIVDAAVADGRVAPANRQAWRDNLDRDEDGTTALLATLSPAREVPVGEIGTGVAPEGEDAAYNKLFPKES